MSDPIIVGITGYARSGKDTAARALTGELGFKKIAFADSLKRDLMVLDPYIDNAGTRLSFAYNYWEMSLEDIKENFPEWRRLMQIYGTEVWRAVDPHIWVTRTTTAINKDWVENATAGYVIPDLRFENERRLINFDLVVRIDRPGIGPLNDHASETYVGEMDVDFVLVNDGTEVELHQQMLDALNSVL